MSRPSRHYFKKVSTDLLAALAVEVYGEAVRLGVHQEDVALVARRERAVAEDLAGLVVLVFDDRDDLDLGVGAEDDLLGAIFLRLAAVDDHDVRQRPLYMIEPALEH